jgi:hypothetical protein
MKAFEPFFEDLQNAIFASRSDSAAGQPCPCSNKAGNADATEAASEALFKCMDCFVTSVTCSGCAVKSHTHHPFHRVARWNGQFFQDVSLSQLGLTLHLGHNGHPCPNGSTVQAGRTFVIVHTNGFHRMAIAFCACRSDKGDAVPQFRQLVTAGLFPATLTQPESVFTFDVLDNWHQHALTSKKSAHDYHDALRRLTNPVFLSDVPVRVFSHPFWGRAN